MLRLKFFLLLSTYLLFTSCFNYNSKKVANQEYDKVKNCRNNWIYEDLKEKKEIKVLLFDEKRCLHNHCFPNFILGVTNANDTIAILDKGFEGLVKINSKITIEPQHWIGEEKEDYLPAFIVSNKTKENDLLCRVKYVYYGKINK